MQKAIFFVLITSYKMNFSSEILISKQIVYIKTHKIMKGFC